MHASQDWSDDLGELRAFAEALVVGEDAQALARRLVKQATFARLAWPAGGALSPKARMFKEFIALHRRYVRKAGDSAEERDAFAAGPRPLGAEAAAARRLPLDLREALLLVAVSRFSHAEAALALDLALPRLTERLLMARERLAEALDPARANLMRRAPHLRLVK